MSDRTEAERIARETRDEGIWQGGKKPTFPVKDWDVHDIQAYGEKCAERGLRAGRVGERERCVHRVVHARVRVVNHARPWHELMDEIRTQLAAAIRGGE